MRRNSQIVQIRAFSFMDFPTYEIRGEHRGFYPVRRRFTFRSRGAQRFSADRHFWLANHEK
jgi:hypothetical protein